MINLTIGTWNLEDNYSLTGINEKKVDAIIELLMDNQIRILGLQGVSPVLAQKLDEKLKKIYGYYSITSAYKKRINPIRNLIDKYNLIISDLPYYHSQQFKLPIYFKSMIGDYSDCSLIQQSFLIGNDTVRFYNTCLFDNDDEMNCRQLNALYAYLLKDMISYQDMNSILFGSFFDKPDSKNMKYFTEILNGVNLDVIENHNPTFKNEIADYIVVPNNYIVDSVECIDNYDENISDHNPVIAKIIK